MTPDDIYIRAVAAARAQSVPAFVTYRAAYVSSGAVLGCTDGRVVVTFEGRSASGSYRVSFRSSDASARTTDLASKTTCSGAPLIEPTGGDIGSLLGTPAHVQAAEPERSPLPTIASVRVASALYYDVLSANMERLDNAGVYHLTLRAIGDRTVHPLTDLYVDTESFLVRRVVGTFSDVYGGVPATIVATGDFARDRTYWVETREHVEFSAATVPKSTRATLDATASDFAFPESAP